MVWAVVSFDNENTVEVVPVSWYIMQSKECFWPPRTVNKSKIGRLINNLVEPSIDWKLHSATILGEYDNLGVAKKKAQRAEFTSDLNSTQSEEAGRGIRKMRPNPRYKNKSTSEEDSNEESSSDGNVYPKHRALCFADPLEAKLSSKGSSPICSTNDLNQHVVASQHSQGVSSVNSHILKHHTEVNNLQDSSVAHSPSTSKQTVSSRSDRASMICERGNVNSPLQNSKVVSLDFEQKVLREMSLLHLKIDSVLECIRVLNRMPETQITQVQNAEELYSKIPINLEEDLTIIEEWLENKNNYKLTVVELGRIGGTSMPQTTRKLLYRILSNDIANKFSWDGVKQKRPFKSLILSKVILDAVKVCYRQATETDIISVIKAWLVKAKERMKNQKLESRCGED